MAEIKQLKEKKTDEIFYPVTVGEAVIFEDDNTNAAITEAQMDIIFGFTRNYINLTPVETDNYAIFVLEESNPAIA